MAKDNKTGNLPGVPTGGAIPKGPRKPAGDTQANLPRTGGAPTNRGPSANPNANQKAMGGKMGGHTGGTRIPAGPPTGTVADCGDVLATMFARRGNLSPQEIRFITEEFQRRGQGAQAGLDMPDAQFRKIAAELASEIREAAFIRRRNDRLNAAAKQRLLDMAREAHRLYGDAAIGLEAAAVGSNKPLPGNRMSADGRSITLFSQYMGMMTHELEAAGLFPHLNTGYIDGEIARALEKLTKPEARGSTHAQANAIAEIIHKYRKLAFDRENRAGAWRKPLPGYIASQMWDMAKIRRSTFEEWRDFVMPRLDHERTFKGANPEAFLREAYRTLANGEELSFKTAKDDLSLEFQGPGNIAKKASEHRVLHFKDADAWMEANTQYGRGTLRGAILAEFEIAARDTALMETFGTNPRALFDDVVETLKRELSDDPEAVDRLSRSLRFSLVKKEMATILGDTDAARNVAWAQRGQNARAWISAAKLGGAVLSAVSDIAFKASAIRYANGGGILTPLAEAFGTFFKGMGRQSREVADLIGSGLDGHSASLARFAGTDATPGAGNRMLRTFFKYNLLAPWTDANKRGLGLYTSRMLATHAGSAFEQLPEHMKFLLSQFDIGPAEWAIARRAVQPMSDGKTYMLPHLIHDMPEELFTSLDPTGMGSGLRGRDQVESTIRNLFTDIVEMGVPTPGAKERAIMTWGFKAGTVEGEAMRFLMQFKGFPITAVSRNINRLAYGNPGGTADKTGLAMLLASSLVLGYAAMSAKAAFKGQTPRDPTDYKTWIAAMVQGGGAGIYGDFLFGEFNRFGRSPIETLAGPGLGIAGDVLELIAKVRAGDDVAATSLRLAMSNAPFLNIFYTRTALDYLILYELQEMANPGYLRRRERQLKKEQGQTFMLPQPSRVISRGGRAPGIFEGVR